MSRAHFRNIFNLPPGYPLLLFILETNKILNIRISFSYPYHCYLVDTIEIIAFPIVYTSSIVFSLLSVMRMVPSAYSLGVPIALITCEIVFFPEVQADPVEMMMFFRSNLCMIASPSLSLIEMLMFPGSRFWLV